MGMFVCQRKRTFTFCEISLLVILFLPINFILIPIQTDFGVFNDTLLHHQLLFPASDARDREQFSSSLVYCCGNGQRKERSKETNECAKEWPKISLPNHVHDFVFVTDSKDPHPNQPITFVPFLDQFQFHP